MTLTNSLKPNTLYNGLRYAYWIYLCDDRFKCSNCGAMYSNVDNKTICPACKAEIINSGKEN